MNPKDIIKIEDKEAIKQSRVKKILSAFSKSIYFCFRMLFKLYLVCLFICTFPFSLFFIFWKSSTKCKKCKKFYALKYMGRELIETKKSTIKKVEKTYNKNREVIREKECFVPATVYVYKHSKKCKYCGEIISYTEEEKKIN